MARVTALQPVAERVSVLETKVENIDEKLDDLKVDVKEMHDCLDRTRDLIDSKLDDMLDEYRKGRDNYYAHADKLHEEDQAAHQALATRLSELERQKHKFITYAMIGLAFAAGAGWINHLDIDKLVKFFL